MGRYEIKNLIGNPNVIVTEEKGSFKVIERVKDLSVTSENAQAEYFSSEMNVRRKQLICNLESSDVVLQIGEMQWMVGNVKLTTGIKGAGDYFSKTFKGALTKESGIKPEYTGTGTVVCEPTYKHIILLDLDDWDNNLVIEDGMFLASEKSVQHKIVSRSNLSSAMLGGEGLFNLSLRGKGVIALESNVPYEELVEIKLEDDVVKIDGNMAIAWSNTLNFTVEKAAKGFIGSAATGEGFVNVYRGTGTILMSPY